MATIAISDDKATITINRETREFEIEWIDSHPKLIDCSIGIKIGANGQKVWSVPAAIKKNVNHGRVRQPEWVIAPAYMPLNSINRGFCAVREIVGFTND